MGKSKMAMDVYSIEDVKKILEAAGYSPIKQHPNSKKTLIVYVDKSERVPTTEKIAAMFDGTVRTSSKSSSGIAEFRGLGVITKPLQKGVVGGIQFDARAFSGSGKPGKFNYVDNEIQVTTFTDYRKIEESILNGCENEKILGETYVDAFKSFFDNGKINWALDVPAAIQNKLGVYVGEVLIGWSFMKGPDGIFANNPFKGKPVAFHMPTDPAFSGVDSFIEMKDGTFYALSSKYGGGAKASFFTNVFETGIKKRKGLQKSYFKSMCDFAAANNIAYKKTKDFIYNFGVREVLEIDNSAIITPTIVYDQIREDNIGDETLKVIEQIKEKTNESLVIDNLPKSVSGYFNRTIADNLNKDKKSMEQMTDILAGKDFWQVNLDIKSWERGDLKFNFLSSGKTVLNIVGSKSAINDITSKQGWLNYELKY